jgi:hypothetical protein
MILTLPENLNLSKDHETIVKAFMQLMLNRLAVGSFRYGPANRNQKYLTRLKKELQVYEKLGNAEQLLNIANYCILEWIAPEHPKHYWDSNAKSATRKDS